MEVVLEVLYRSCAGIDVHKASLTACVRIVEGKSVTHEVREFPTTIRALGELQKWLAEREVRAVVMEATGVYWKPVWHILEADFQLTLANAGHVKNVPGRKTDVKDAVWLADLHAHGLIRGSFVPPQPIEELRQLTRTRKQLVREVGQHTNRLHKVLEDTNIKVGNVVTDILGQSGRAILRKLISGVSDPEELAKEARGRLKQKHGELVEALEGYATEHHRFLLELHLSTVESLERRIEELDQRLGRALDPFKEAVQRLETIPGVGTITAQVIVAEIGLDMSRFPTHRHLLSWAGLCPRSDESAGKPRSTQIRKGAPWLKAVIVQAAWGATHKKDSYLRTQYLRIRARRGAKKAAVAVAASILTSAFYILQRGTTYEDLGADHFTQHNMAKAAARHCKQLQQLGYKVTLERQAA
jgi:transposase